MPRFAVNVKDVPAQAFVEKFAQYLKESGKVTLPEWTDMVKTGTFKELAPYNEDWFYVRAASVARRMYVRGKAIGVGGLRKVYGGKVNRGNRPEHTRKAAGGVLRNVVHQLAAAGILAKGADPSNPEMSFITDKGRQAMDRIAVQIHKGKN